MIVLVLLRIELRGAEGRKHTLLQASPTEQHFYLYCTQNDDTAAIILSLMGKGALDGRVVCRLPLTLLWWRELSEENETCRNYNSAVLIF